MTIERVPEPDSGADERNLLLSWLAFHRDALAAKCADLTDEQLRTRSTPPSVLSLVGLVRHLTEMERSYLSRYLNGLPQQFLYCTDENPDGDFDLPGDVDVSGSLRRWRTECDASDDALRRYPNVTAVPDGKTKNVRWVLLKVVGEYARHNGHADLIREAIDGRTGE